MPKLFLLGSTLLSDYYCLFVGSLSNDYAQIACPVDARGWKRIYYAKKSGNGKAVYWYVYEYDEDGIVDSSAVQYNELGITYNYMAFA